MEEKAAEDRGDLDLARTLVFLHDLPIHEFEKRIIMLGGERRRPRVVRWDGGRPGGWGRREAHGRSSWRPPISGRAVETALYRSRRVCRGELRFVGTPSPPRRVPVVRRVQLPGRR